MGYEDGKAVGNEDSWRQKKGGGFNPLDLILVVAMSWSAIWAALLRKPGTAGCRYWLNMHFVLGLCFMWVFFAVFPAKPGDASAAAFAYMPYAMGGLWLLQILASALPNAPGRKEHSRYWGDSNFRWHSAEPLALAGLAFIAANLFGEALAAYFLGAAASHGVVLAWVGAAERSRLRDMEDAQWQARQDANYFGRQ